MMMFGSDTERFLTLLAYIIALKETDETSFNAMRTFEGFCGLFCNSRKLCPIRTVKCNYLSQPIKCFTSFAEQSYRLVNAEVTTKIYELFSGIDTISIGKRFSLPDEKSLKRMLPKKERKRIRKLIKKARSSLKSLRNLNTNNYQRNDVSCSNNHLLKKKKIWKRKKPTTTFFHNDDEEWSNKINSYLEKKPEADETNNRQSTNTA